MPYDVESEIYNKIQLINVLHKNEVYVEHNLLIHITEFEDVLKIKVRDANEYNFNYSTVVNSFSFEKMKREQSLEINFGEFIPQMLELLKAAELHQMCLRFEVYEAKARMVFYEKAKLKSLIFLVIDLNHTEQNEIIREMSFNIQYLKEQNSNLLAEMHQIKRHINDKEAEMQLATTKRCELQKQYLQHLANIDTIVSKNLQRFQSVFYNKIAKVNSDLLQLVKDVEVYRERDNLRRTTSLQTIQTVQELRLDLRRSQETIAHLEERNRRANEAKVATEQQVHEIRLAVAKKEEFIRGLEEKISELNKDMQNATLIIAEKSKTNDEIARDLVQANQMIVNFNNRIDKMADENQALQEQMRLKDDIINEHKGTISRLRQEFEDYKDRVKMEEIVALKEELLMARKEVETVEKQNRELAKLNAVLTRKVAGNNMWTAQTR